MGERDGVLKLVLREYTNILSLSLFLSVAPINVCTFEYGYNYTHEEAFTTI